MGMFLRNIQYDFLMDESGLLGVEEAEGFKTQFWQLEAAAAKADRFG